MSIQCVIAAALELQERLQEIGLPFCFIGGIAVQRWGEPRLTVDADATVLTDWTHDERLTDALLASFAGRRADSREFALRHRVLLLSGSDGTPLDVALGGRTGGPPARNDVVKVVMMGGASLLAAALLTQFIRDPAEKSQAATLAGAPAAQVRRQGLGGTRIALAQVFRFRQPESGT